MEDVSDPCGCAGGISRQCYAVRLRQVSAKFGNDIVIHGTFPNPAQSQNDLRAFRIFRGDKPWGNVTENDFGFTATDAAARTGGEVPAFHGYLITESEHVGSVSPGGKDVATRLALDEILHSAKAGTE